MKRWACASLAVVALLAGSVMPGEAHGRYFHSGSRFFVGFSLAPAWWYPYPYWYYPPYVYAPPPTVIVQQPPVYIEQQAPPAGSAPAEPTQYWYYCVPSGAYYPNVQTCSEAWVKVPARGPR